MTSKLATVALPKDGAAYRCTYTDRYGRCGVTTKRGLTMADYEALLTVKPSGVSFMRALCSDHVTTVSAFITTTA